MRRLLPTALCMLAFTATGQQGPHQPLDIRYHLGDDPNGKLGWANPDFDDSGWPIQTDGSFPLTPAHSDGFVWVRIHMQGPAVFEGPPALALLGRVNAPAVQEFFVNGVPVGQYGTFPPHASPRIAVREMLFSLPSQAVKVGGANTVAIRSWSTPGQTELNKILRAGRNGAIRIGSQDILQAEMQADRATALLAEMPYFLLDVLLALLGVAMLLLWRFSPSQELLFCALWLIVMPVYVASVYLSAGGFFPPQLAAAAFSGVIVIQAAGMGINVELTRSVLQIRSPAFRIAAHAFWVLFNLGEFLAAVRTQPGLFTDTAVYCEQWALGLFNSLMLCASLGAFFVLRRSRTFAAANGFINIIVLLQLANVSSALGNGPVPAISLWSAGFYASTFAIAFTVIAGALRAWRSARELRAEFDAARDVQARLIAPAADLPGFKIEGAYQPAKEVGGDFFFVRAGNKGAYQDNRDLDGGAFVVVGDVSGKGLRAALTVSAIMGALRTMPDLEPARILVALNRGLIGQLGGGFVTCCAVTISANGTAFFANAGHLQPYCNGKEVTLDCGLPLGILPDAQFTETRVRLAPTDRLTLITDGILEARDPTSGELFGFDRTQAITTKPAEAIAQAAQAFGQEDDITVLTLAFTPLEVAHA